jgi:hypothetical protein
VCLFAPAASWTPQSFGAWRLQSIAFLRDRATLTECPDVTDSYFLHRSVDPTESEASSDMGPCEDLRLLQQELDAIKAKVTCYSSHADCFSRSVFGRLHAGQECGHALHGNDMAGVLEPVPSRMCDQSTAYTLLRAGHRADRSLPKLKYDI